MTTFPDTAGDLDREEKVKIQYTCKIRSIPTSLGNEHRYVVVEVNWVQPPVFKDRRLARQLVLPRITFLTMIIKSGGSRETTYQTSFF